MSHQTKLRSARRRAPQQIDMFAAEPRKIGGLPAWCALPMGDTNGTDRADGRSAAGGVQRAGFERKAGEIEAIQPDGPWIFSRPALSTASARAVTERARQNPKYPTGSHPDQQNLFSSIIRQMGVVMRACRGAGSNRGWD
jgi:hypothetical protein